MLVPHQTDNNVSARPHAHRWWCAAAQVTATIRAPFSSPAALLLLTRDLPRWVVAPRREGKMTRIPRPLLARRHARRSFADVSGILQEAKRARMGVCGRAVWLRCCVSWASCRGELPSLMAQGCHAWQPVRPCRSSASARAARDRGRPGGTRLAGNPPAATDTQLSV